MPNTNTMNVNAEHVLQVMNDANDEHFEVMYTAMTATMKLEAMYDEIKENGMHDNTNIIDEQNDEQELVNPTPCDNCGEVHELDDLIEVRTAGGIELWCPECVDRDAISCDRCGNLVAIDDVTSIETYYSTREWCPECVENHATPCERCGDYVADDDTYTVITRAAHYRHGWYDSIGRWHSPRWVEAQTEEWCEDCVDDHAIVCEDCDERFAEDSDAIECIEMYDGEERYVCTDCRDNHYRICDGCGGWVHDDDSYYDDDHDATYCPDCYRRHGSDAIEGYCHTRGMCFWLDAETKKYWDIVRDEETKLLYLGVELEVDDVNYRGDCASELVDEWDCDHIALKEDGSLTDRGFEIVSQPMTIEAHLNMGMWESISEIVRRHDGKSHEAGTCGLHIHGSRDALNGRDAVYRLDRLFHRFGSQMQRFARRTNGQMRWCTIGHDDLKDIKDVADRKAKWMDEKNWNGRYQAVNDTNTHTVEIRLWRGTLNVETIRATLEFTWGLFQIANKMSDEFADQLTWSMVKVLVRFALEEAGLPHDDFDRYIERRGL